MFQNSLLPAIILMNFKFQVFEAEKMNTKKGMYHKKCFACISCKSQLHYYGAIEGPDDEVNYFFLSKSLVLN